jgi:DNA-directed RNA polymerase subunit M/transcription elongation factor TFIIS
MILTIPNPEVFRTNIRHKLSTILSTDDDTISGNLEKGIYNYAIQKASNKNIVKKWDNPSFVNLYIDRLRSVYMNLKNSQFLEKIKSKEIPAEKVASMTHYEMFPSHWEESLEKKMMRDASRLNTNIQASTDMYTCKRCKSKKTTYYEVATRSADEQMTIFITCLDCGKNWKQ